MASATGSKFQAFMNHPAGPKTYVLLNPDFVPPSSPHLECHSDHCILTSLPTLMTGKLCNSLLLGAFDEVVPGSRRTQRPFSTSRQDLGPSERRTGSNRHDLGPILARHHTGQLLARCSQLFRRLQWFGSALPGLGLQETAPRSGSRRG